MLIDQYLKTRPWTVFLALWRMEPVEIAESEVDTLIEFALTHKVMGHLCATYQKQKSQNPAVLKRFQNAYAPVQQKALRRCAELIQIQKTFKTQNIRLMPFKGVTLSQKLFNDPSIKQSSDLDILVAHEDVLNAHNLLLTLDYKLKMKGSVSDKNINHLLSIRKDFVYFNDQGVCVELHWRLNENPHFLPLDFESSWKNSVSQTLANDTFQVFNKNDYLIYLCVHGSLSFFHRLSWLVDIASLLKSENFHWPSVMQRAIELGVERTLVISVIIACSLNHQNYPKEIGNYCEKNLNCKHLLKTLICRLQQPFLSEFHIINQWIKWQLASKRKTKLANIQAHVWSRYRHCQTVKMPTQLYWVTYFLEPIFSIYWGLKHTRSGFARIYNRFKSTCST